MKYFCFRFDIDTHKCIRDGVPNLIFLSKKNKVKFTFFINVGKSVDKWEFVKNYNPKSKQSDVKALSSFAKLGLKDYLFASIYNPVLGKIYQRQIKMIYDSGNEVGLHGGRNHETWFRNAKKWNSKQIVKEIGWGMGMLCEIDKRPILGFTSPGWNGSAKINKALNSLGFLYVSDIHTDQPFEKINSYNRLQSMPTNIVGEPGGVGYIENCRAKGMSNREILSDFRNKLNKRKRLAVMYDHPYYVGVKEIELLKEMISIVKEMGFKIVPMKDLINR